MIVRDHGESAWDAVSAVAGVDDNLLLANQSYDDAVTYDIVGAASEKLGLSAESFLFSFGEFWVLNTGLNHYGPLLRDCGRDPEHFFRNLPGLHDRIILYYPDLRMPVFTLLEAKENEITMSYRSQREHLGPMVEGLFSGVLKMFGKQGQVHAIAPEQEDDGAKYYRITWS